MMATMLAFAFACAAGMVLSLRAAARRPRRRCPACRQLLLRWVDGALATNPGPDDRPFGASCSHYRCSGCQAEFFEENAKGLVTREAWEAGAREPIPGARIVE